MEEKRRDRERAQRLEVDAFPTSRATCGPSPAQLPLSPPRPEIHNKKKIKNKAQNKTKSKRTRLGGMKEEGREDRKVEGQVSGCIIPEPLGAGGEDSPAPRRPRGVSSSRSVWWTAAHTPCRNPGGQAAGRRRASL